MSRDGSESNYHMIPQSYGGGLPDYPQILPPGLAPCNHNSQGYTNHSAPAPYVSSHLTSLAAPAHLNSVYTAGVHPTPQMLMHPNPHFIHTNQPSSLTQITRQPQSIKQETGGLPCFIEQGPGLIRSQGPPFIKEEPGLFAPTFIKQEPDSLAGGHLPPGGNLPHREHPFIKEEPGLPPGGHMFIKQEPGLVQGLSKQFSLDDSRCISNNFSFLDKKPGVYCGNGQGRGHPKQDGPGEMFPAFPSQPLYLNFMADIEDIMQPSNGEVSIESIQRELSSFEGTSDFKRSRGKVIKEEEDTTWEPPLWKQQYENIRKMRSKRDAPVDKYGCFKNAETEVSPEVRRYQVLVSLMLSSQTKDEVVGKAMIKLKENGLTIGSILNTPQEEVARMIFPVGFWNKKSEYIKKTTKLLEEKFAGDIPNCVEDLVSLPGIGPKMAHLIMDFAWGEVSGIAVDTHVHRITHRLGWMKKETRNPEEARRQLEKWIPRSEWSDLNLLCVGFGQQVCSPVAPKCSDCLNKDLCPSSSCLVNSSGLPLGIGFEMSTKSKGKKAKSNSVSAVKTKKIKIEK